MIYHLHNRGFTFVETLVAISILLVALVTPLTIITQTSRSNTLANEQIIAFFLAQEGLELAVQLRDQASLGRRQEANTGVETLTVDPWYTAYSGADDFLATCGDSSGCGLYRFDESSGQANEQAESPIDCGSASCLLYIKSNGPRVRYAHALDPSAGNTEATPYTRVVRLDDSGLPPDEMKIISTVTWRSGLFFQEQRVQVSTNVFNVYE